MPRRLPHGLLTREVVESYCERMSDADAADELGVAMVTFYKKRRELGILSFFERSGLRKRKNGESYMFHQYNERFFQSIDTPEKAYFLGLMASDGNVSPRLTAARIALKADDAHILEEFRLCLGNDAPLLRDKTPYINGVANAAQKVLVLSRKAMVQDLIALGVTPRKSHTLELVSSVDANLLPHLIRGVWDGDGSITEKRFKVTTASVKFAHQLQNWITQISGVRLPISPDNKTGAKPLYCLCGYKRDAAAIRAIYGGMSPVLHRKRDRYLSYWDPRR
jgi:hypothetical protein